MALKFDVTTRNNMGDQITARVGNAGKLRIYSGTRPANVAASITGTLLAELTGGTPWAPATASGDITLNAITADSSADNSGTASHHRWWQSNGTTACIDGDTGTSGSDLNLNTTTVTAGGNVSVSSAVYTMPGA